MRESEREQASQRTSERKTERESACVCINVCMCVCVCVRARACCVWLGGCMWCSRTSNPACPGDSLRVSPSARPPLASPLRPLCLPSTHPFHLVHSSSAGVRRLSRTQNPAAKTCTRPLLVLCKRRNHHHRHHHHHYHYHHHHHHNHLFLHPGSCPTPSAVHEGFGPSSLGVGPTREPWRGSRSEHVRSSKGRPVFLVVDFRFRCWPVRGRGQGSRRWLLVWSTERSFCHVRNLLRGLLLWRTLVSLCRPDRLRGHLLRRTLLSLCRPDRLRGLLLWRTLVSLCRPDRRLSRGRWGSAENTQRLLVSVRGEVSSTPSSTMAAKACHWGPAVCRPRWTRRWRQRDRAAARRSCLGLPLRRLTQVLCRRHSLASRGSFRSGGYYNAP